jgi:phosphoglycolate phosphatase-like HAD superfamily hydrolase
MMRENVIALIFDFDITLSPEFQQQVLFDHWGIEADSFWQRCAKLLDDGYDLEHSYIKTLIDLGKEDSKYKLSNKDLFEFGKQIELYEGLSRKDGKRSIFDDLYELLDEKNYKKHNISLECYCISGGLTPMIQGAFEAHGLKDIFKEVFACTLAEDENGHITFVKETVGHTIKTQKLFMISKGTLPSQGAKLDDVNKVVSEFRIPFDRMIFLGDGQTDIPAFSLLNSYGGTSIAVYKEIKDPDGNICETSTIKSYENGYNLAIKAKRAQQLLNADYSQAKPLKLTLIHKIKEIADEIISSVDKRV